MRFLITILLFISLKTFGQISACFTIDNPSGCVPHTINVTDCSGENPQYTYELPPDWTTSTTHTFTEAGSYSVVQAVPDGVNFKFDTQNVTVFPTPIPQVEITNCGNNEVFLESINLGYDKYIIDWNDGNIDTFNTAPSTPYSYTNSNTRNIKISGIYTPEFCGNDTSITITPFQNFEKSNIDILEVINSDSILLTLSGQENVIYKYSGASTGENFFESTTFSDSIGGLITNTNEYCFEIQAINKCDASALVPSSKSDKVCSVVLSGQSQPGFNEINWASYSGDNTPTYELNRNQSLLNSFTSSQNSYKDSSIFCSQEYLYQLETKTALSTSISNKISIIGKSESSPNPISNIFSTYNNSNELEISWKSATKIPPQFYTVNTTQTTDTFLISNSISRDCYEITFTDSCGNTSQISEETCPIILDVKQNTVFELEFNWNNYQTFKNGLSFYKIYIYDNEKNLIQNIDNNALTNYIFDVLGEENQIYYFKIEGISNDSISTFSNTVQLELKNRIIMPNAFTPNGDGENDIFIPKVRFVKDFKFSIYNKWGTSLFTSFDQNNGWDGDNLPPGVYSYIVEVTDYLGETTVEKGTVTLIR